MRHMQILFIMLFILCLISCQAEGGETEPRLLIDWEPTPVAIRTPLPVLEDDASSQSPVESGTNEAEAEPLTEPLQPIADDVKSPPFIPTLAPTPIPVGVYVRESDGFEVSYPTSWEVVDSSGMGIQLADPGFGLFVNVFSGVLDDETSYESMIGGFQDEVDFLSDITLVSEEEILYGDEGIIKVAMLSAVDEEGNELAIRMAHMVDGGRAKQLMAMGLQENIEAREATLNAIIGQAKPGGSQLFGLSRDETVTFLGSDPLPIHLDPARTTGGAGGFIGLLYRGLVHLSPDLQIVPDLAESWTVSDDGTVYTFTLREGVMFESGKPLTANDVKNSWERAADPRTESTTASTYLDDILGVPEKLAGESENIVGLSVIDDRTLEVTLDGPKPYFLAKLTYPTAFILDLESIDEEIEEWIYTPNASGPYTLSEYREDEAFIFEKNEAYYDPGTIPHAVYLLYRIGSGISLFESNEVDVVFLNATESQDVRLPSSPLHDQWQSATSLCTSLVQVNNNIAPMDDIHVRQAFALSVDREQINEMLSEGMEVEANTILPPAMPGFSLDLAETRREAGYDPDEARAALAKSAYAEDLPAITILTGGYGDTESDLINALVDGWYEDLGVEVSVEYVDPENYSEAVRNTLGQLVTYGWCADYPDPQNFLDILYYSDSEFNVAGYRNEELDTLLVDSRTELDPTQRLEQYQEIEEKLLEDYAAIPLVHGVRDILINPRIKGFILSPINDSPINSLSIETTDGG